MFSTKCMKYTIKQLADLANITVRTLHHYDRIGLLKPARVNSNGYRVYEHRQLLLLQQILFFRELEFSLSDIKVMLASPDFEIVDALMQQKQMLKQKAKRTAKLLQTIEITINAMKNNSQVTDSQLYDPWQDNDVKEYQAEAKNRWGATDAYKQSMQRVQNMTKQEMDKLKEKQKAHTQAIAGAMNKGVEDPYVQAHIKQVHESINLFYDCSSEMFRKLGEMYVQDPRFAKYYESFRPGLAAFMCDSIAYYCDQNS